MRITVGDHSIEFDLNLGGRATSWRVGDLELLGARDEHPVSHGMYPMAPWAGRLRENSCEIDGALNEFPLNLGKWAIHGTVFMNQVEVVEQTLDEVEFRYVSEGPFDCVVEMGWQLSDSALRTTLQLSTSAIALPAVIGWHPWFNRKLERGFAAEWHLADARVAVRAEDYLPSGELVDLADFDGAFDDAFFVPSREAVISWPGALNMKIVNSHPWFVVYDEPESFALIEPQTGPPNGSNNPITGDRITVRVGQPLTMVTDWIITRVKPVDQV
ncbi:MAG: aldose 1-epimerase [Candidatus Nanopelagicales bacterium]